MVLETVFLWPFNHLTGLLAKKCFIEFSGTENFKLNTNVKLKMQIIFVIVQKITGITYQGKKND